MVKVNKKYKDRLFRMVFNSKEELLELYNAMTDSSYTNPEDLEIVTLEDVIYMGMKNDVAFFIDDALNLYEHQSSWNPNMPIRGTFYMTDEYRKYIEKNGLNIYGSRLVRLPIPQYVVFYNGLKEEPDRMEMSLSDAFSERHPKLIPCMEFKAVLLNINLGRNGELLERCRRLKDYARFVARVRQALNQEIPLGEAIDRVVVSCIEDGILADFLSGHRAEVCEVILTEYDEQRHIADEKEASWEDGRREGREVGNAEADVRMIRKKHRRHLPAEQVADVLELDETYVCRVMDLLDRHEEFNDLEIAECLPNGK